MTQQEAKLLLPLIKALAEGKTLQVKGRNTWEDTQSPLFLSDFEYRVKPEPLVLYVNVYKNKYNTATWYGIPTTDPQPPQNCQGPNEFIRNVKMKEIVDGE